MNRRFFIKTGVMAGMGVGLAPYSLFATEEFHKLTILHTNDTHSRIEPFPEGSRFAGMGGIAKRAAIINSIRQAEKHVLLLDAGDIFQGTPYFNVFGGELEFKAMSQMQYDASTLGNHDFDAGLEGLAKQLPFASFDFVSANYNFENTLLHGKIKPYKIFHKGDIKIGVTGAGIELEGLVPKSLFGNTLYEDPITKINQIASYLKNDEKCDLVICLSHLGYEYKSKKVSDLVLAENSENVDIIIGGHTHTFLDNPMIVNNLIGQPVVVNQVGWAGIVLGRLDVFVKRQKKKNAEKFAPAIFSKKTIVK
jgi:5'-nucleotidase